MTTDLSGLPQAMPDADEPAAPPRLTMVVPFAYDLGGRITDHAAARDVLASLPDVVGPVVVDASAVRSWNLSYLASHAPVLQAELTPDQAVLAGVTWDCTRTLRVYPWLGVATVEYAFVPPTDDVDATTCYDDLVRWKNGDYLRQLHDEGALSAHLAAHTGWQPSDDDADLHRTLVSDLRAELASRGALEARPRLYAFHDFRPCFVLDEARARSGEVDALLLLTDQARADEHPHDVEHIPYRGLQVSTTGWSTVVRIVDAGPRDLRATLDLLGLVHAQWYLCQVWIATHDADMLDADPAAGEGISVELARTQLALARDLVEVESLDLMLKDPAMLRVARGLSAAFGLRDHRAAAERRLKVLDDYARQIAEITQARDAQRLQILFSLSAAGTIAGLVPAVAALQSSWVLAAATVVVGLALWLGFAVNFAMLIRRRNAAAHARTRPGAVRRRGSIWRTAAP